MPKFNREQIREKIAQLQNRVVPLAIPIPGLEELQDQLGLRVLSIATTMDIRKKTGSDKSLSEEETGQHGTALMLAHSLVLLDSRERIFSDDDIALLLALPVNVFQSIAVEITKISGVTEKAIQDAKND